MTAAVAVMKRESGEAPMPLSLDLVWQETERNRSEAQEAHKRIREDLNSAYVRLAAMESGYNTLLSETKDLRQALRSPVELSSLRLTPGMVASILAFVATIILTIIGSAWWFSASFQSLETTVSYQGKQMDTLQKTELLNQLKIEDVNKAILRLEPNPK